MRLCLVRLIGETLRNIILKVTDNEDLESKMTIDRVVNIDDNNVLYLCDTMFIINENDIQGVLND